MYHVYYYFFFYNIIQYSRYATCIMCIIIIFFYNIIQYT